MQKVLKKIKKLVKGESSPSHRTFDNDTLIISKVELQRKVQEGTEKASKEYSKTFEILANND